ncbi:HOG (high osmolarity glycerol) pathway protein [Coemansia erecta]|uniref:HOG (High osmolarity glycerol) pathway protein n=1 Tax=Coemansia erecta TaxID=147472 RepID=A0A9W7XY31_9FUNG|nr:HOG (high osmolarity glycerol) pathway protein [Coemansia erecta]
MGTIVRDFAYSKDDPRHAGQFKEIAREDDADADDSDSWSSSISGEPGISADDDTTGSSASSTMGMARALYDFEAENPTELAFAENDILHITYKQCDGWLVGFKDNQVGLIPENYVELISSKAK